MVVLTDGQWNTPPSLATVSASITANTFAGGLGLPSNISVPALTTLCQGHNGFLRVTGAISTDQSMRLTKYFLQVLAGITNAEVAAEPSGVLDVTVTHRIPFWMSEADYGMDLIVLSPYPQVIDFQWKLLTVLSSPLPRERVERTAASTSAVTCRSTVARCRSFPPIRREPTRGGGTRC